MAKKKKTKLEEFEKALGDSQARIHVLRLCISGMTPRSRRALVNLKQICDQYLEDNYELEVIDLYQQPELAVKNQVVATPTLLKTAPLPLRRMFGDLSDIRGLLQRLGISTKEAPSP